MKEKYTNEQISRARELAAQAWCGEKTKNIDMDVILAEEFAKILVVPLYSPHLGCATTEELLTEIKTRIEMDGKLDYRTIDGS